MLVSYIIVTNKFRNWYLMILSRNKSTSEADRGGPVPICVGMVVKFNRPIGRTVAADLGYSLRTCRAP